MKKILVIEDEQILQENILEILEGAGFNTIGAENGHVGVTWAWEHKPDLIVCDVMMPELDGYEVLKLLRQDPVTATIPFIFLTAKADKADFRRGMDLGADDYLTKPFTTTELLGAIAARLERQAAIARSAEQKLETPGTNINALSKYTNTTIFVNEFLALKQAQFTGRLLVSGKQEWTFYLYMGRILYAGGGVHPVRRWQRNLATYCPQIKLDDLNLPADSSIGEYQVLGLWLKQQQISREQVAQIIQAVVAELLFDVLQAKQVMYQTKQEDPLPWQMLLINPESAIAAAQQTWQTWQTALLTDISPNSAPVVKRPEALQQQTSAATYHQLTMLLDGQRTLQDLALQMKRQVVAVTASLLPYIQTGVVELIEIPDLPVRATPAARAVPLIQTAPHKPLIACIDDSPSVCQIMEKMITEAGYQFVAVQDPLRAIATLLSRKPDLIFLDLVMPNLNGYEICARLRKISAFCDIPIVILTSNIIDRVLAKTVGSSDYLSKPVKEENVLTVIQKHLSGSVKLA